MSGGDLPGTFIFVEAEFHTSMRGQNLKIDLIHFNSKYLTFEQSKKHPDGLAIISIFFKKAGNGSRSIGQIVKALEETATSNLFHFSMETFLPENPEAYYRYQGSFSKPSCNEIVTWTVMEEQLSISEDQFDKITKWLQNDNTTQRVDDDLTSFAEKNLVGSSKSKWSLTSKEGPKYSQFKGTLYSEKTNLDHFFLCTLGIIVFFMQCGFAFTH